MSLTKAGSIVVQNPDSPNFIINGDFNIWQRGTSWVPMPSSKYGPDRFLTGETSDGDINLSRSTDVPTISESGHKSNYSLRIDVGTVDTSLTTTQYVAVRYKVEVYDFAHLHNHICDLSFWVKSPKTGVYTVGFGAGGFDASYVAEFTINTASTWEKKTIIIPFSDSIGTWSYTNVLGLDIHFGLDVGPTYQTTKDTWTSGFRIGTSNNTNFMANTTNYILFSQIKLEKSPVATSFVGRLLSTELRLCQRYFQICAYGAGAYMAAGANLVAGISYMVQPRTTPTLSNETDGALFARTNCSASSNLIRTVDGAVAFRTATATGSTQFSGSIEIDAEL